LDCVDVQKAKAFKLILDDIQQKAMQPFDKG
jgi:hypothetical protein